jgi:membrane fusion protein (multidrug efflux system)
MPKRGVPELCLVIALLAACKRPETQAAMRPPVVEVVRVEQRDVPIYREWIATLDGSVNAQIQPRVSGYVIAQRFREGSFVRKNELLFEIDSRPLRAALDQANAQLAGRVADAARAARDVERDRPLSEARAIPKSQLDNDIQIHNAAVAAVEAARATAHQAELDVGFTRVGSLIDGVVGVAEVQVGNLVSPTSVLTSVSQIDPIRAWIAISEQEYLDVADRLHSAAAAAGAGAAPPGIAFDLILADGSKYPHSGRFLFANRQVDSLTGTLRIATAFPNPGRLLRPGQFGRLRAATRIQHNALLVPQRAVTELQGTFQVMVLRSDSTVAVQPVVLGPQVDSLRVIESGLQPNQLVIVEGTQQARPGIKVAARPYGPARRTGY